VKGEGVPKAHGERFEISDRRSAGIDSSGRSE
jgi:hypothetical protein